MLIDQSVPFLLVYCSSVILQAFQEDMATHQPNMDALNKIAKKRKVTAPTTNPDMTKKITSLYKRYVSSLSLHANVRTLIAALTDSSMLGLSNMCA